MSKMITLTVDAAAGEVQVIASEVLNRGVNVTQGAHTELTLDSDEAKQVRAELQAAGYQVW